MTLRVTMGRHEKTRTSSTSSNIQTCIYRCQIVDISQRAFIVLKHSKNRKISFNVGDAYLADKIKLMINKIKTEETLAMKSRFAVSICSNVNLKAELIVDQNSMAVIANPYAFF